MKSTARWQKKGVWLGKVPKYLSDLWEANSGQEVGKLQITQAAAGKNNLKLRSRPGLKTPVVENTNDDGTPAPSKPKSASALPSEHTLKVEDLRAQTMVVLGEDKTHLKEDAAVSQGSLTMEGRIMKRAECQPPDSLAYLKMKIGHFENSSKPTRHIIQIDKAAVKFKPVAQHAEDVARAKAKKEGAKSVRLDKDVLREHIFHAFEKHQYYRLQDLQQLLNQPASYVKEILGEIAVYNAQPPHKSMWSLKPEYTSYAPKKEEDA